MAGEGQYADRADCQVCLVKRLTAMAVLFVVFAGLCMSNVYDVNIGWCGGVPSREVTVWQ
jgi:hypothetical protein